MIKHFMFKIRWYRWFLKTPFSYFDPAFGPSEEGRENRRIAWARHDAEEPKP